MKRRVWKMKETRMNLLAELRAEEPKGEKPEDPEQQQPEKEEEKPDDKDNTISGYALKFGTESKDLGGFVEVIDPQALEGVDLDNVILLDQHDYSKPLASVKAGTLTLEVDDQGLKFEATIDDSISYAKDLLANVKNGNVDSMSFRFDIDDGSDEFKTDGEKTVRTIKQIKDLFEVSTVTLPAYDDSEVDTRSYERFLNRKEDNNMKKNIVEPKNKAEVRSFADFIRSRGELRDGITTEGASAVIPEDVITPVFELKQSAWDLAQYVTVKEVSNGSGHYPIATNPQGVVLATKEELAEIADVDANMFKDVKYDVETRAGKIALSNEVVEDSAVDIVGEVKNQLQKLVENTDNKHISDLLTGDAFAKVTAKNVDDLKKAFNVTLDPALEKMWLVNQSAFNHLDTLKDNEGRYLLQPNPTAPSGFTLLGAPVVLVSDKLMPNNDNGTYPMILGDLAQAVALFRRNQITAEWDKFDSYSEGLSVVVRNDYKVIDEKAALNISLSAEDAGEDTP